MALDFPAAGEALWAIYDATGIRPEYLLPVLSYESGFRPDVQNFGGAPYYGIGQNGVTDIENYAGVDPHTYLTWSASQQLNTVVKGYFRAVVSRFGPLRSGTRVYQAEYLPGTLSADTALTDVISRAPSAYYEDNKSFDAAGKGYVTLDDLRAVVASQAQKGYVQDAINRTYALRPSETPEDPALGTDFGGAEQVAVAVGTADPVVVVSVAATILAAAAGVSWYMLSPRGALPTPFRRVFG